MFRNRFRISNRHSSGDADRGVYAGLILSALLIGIGVITAGIFTSAMSLLGVLIVFGGTFGAACVQFEVEDLREAWHSFQSILTIKRFDAIARIELLVGLGRSVRRNGLIILDREAERTVEAERDHRRGDVVLDRTRDTHRVQSLAMQLVEDTQSLAANDGYERFDALLLQCGQQFV